MSTEQALMHESHSPMTRYTLAGWLCFAQVVLQFLVMTLGMFQTFIRFLIAAQDPNLTSASLKSAIYDLPLFAWTDLFIPIVAAITIYIFLAFRQLLQEHYSLHNIGRLIMAFAVITVVGYFGGFIPRLLLDSNSFAATGADHAATYPNMLAVAAMGFFFLFLWIAQGIVTIIIGRRMLHIKKILPEPLKYAAYVFLIFGICSVSLIFSWVAALIAPLLLILMGVAFLREKEQAEIV